MAKQIGLHQIKGRVGDHAYYRQTGVRNGLIRSINQGLADRVKNGAEYANTRLNMAEFGQACRIAGVYGKLVVPKWRPMFLAFSQSKLSKKIVALVKQGTGNWGERSVAPASLPLVAGYLGEMSKLPFSDLCSASESGITVSSESANTLEVIAGIRVSADQIAALAAIDADGMTVKALANGIEIGSFDADAKDYAPSSVLAQISDELDVTAAGEFEGTVTIAKPTSTAGTAALVVTFIAMPYRTINNVKHILQEQCRFAAFDVTAKMPA